VSEGRLVITDERMTRFWITLDQAVDFVLWSLDSMSGGEIFVPKLPSMRVVDLADAVGPGLPRDVVGIRPGEKLHEVLITADEGRHAIDAGDAYAVLPEHNWWEPDEGWMEGKPLDDRFAYTSDENDRWLSVNELAALVA
jgi:UDP-N-acetylglucosamine 4,6-dehydratase